MCDDIFGLKTGWVKEFNTLLSVRNIKIRYKIQSRVDLLLQENTLDALSQSGVDTIWVGAESGSQKVLDAMDKGTKVEEIYEATRLMKQEGHPDAFLLHQACRFVNFFHFCAFVHGIQNLLRPRFGTHPYGIHT